MRILVADGAGALAPTCIVFLSYWSHEVEVAHDGLDALLRAQATRPDLVLACAGLERMDGFHLASAIRDDPSLAGTAVALAGPADPAFRHRAHAVGVAEFLETPLDVPALARLVAGISEQRRARSA